MPLQIVRNDITKMTVDVIVNAANTSLLGGGGVDGAIHSAAGPGLLAECMKIGVCGVGDAKITGAYNLPAKYVIHTVGPVYRDGYHGEKGQLESCYIRSLTLAFQYGCESVAFPLISSGLYRYPKDKALRVAVDAISKFLRYNDMQVYLVVYDKASYKISEKLFTNIAEYIDDKYVGKHTDFSRDMQSDTSYLATAAEQPSLLQQIPIRCEYDDAVTSLEEYSAPCAKKDLNFIVQQIDESFSQMLLRKIDEKGMTDAECYKKANIDRKLFSKIRGDINYKPSKVTAIAFAIALELSLVDTKDMLMKAGFALSHSNKFDIIIEYFIEHGNYNVFEINEALFAFDQVLLGV